MNSKRKIAEKNEQAWLKLMQAGKQNFAQGKSRKSAQAFKSATDILPERVEGWVNLGSALLESTRLQASETALKKAISLQPRLMVPHMILGDTQRMQGNISGAIASYQRAVELQRAPLALNKLACILRVQNQLAEAAQLYLEAIQSDPRFSLARVNYATLQLDLQHYEAAKKQLNALAEQALPPPERREVSSARRSLAEYSRLHQAITIMCEGNDLTPLETALRNTPESILQVDEGPMRGVLHYTKSARELTLSGSVESMELPAEWTLVEALFMVPVVNSVGEYQQLRAELEGGRQATGDLLESLNMIAAIDAARSCREDMRDPVQAELHLRHWHALACQDVGSILGGHFKYTQNWTARSPTLKRVDPSMASGTFRHFIEKTYCEFPPGIARVALIFMAVLDFHPFADGNGRVVLTWINRELEWLDLMPMIFTREQGIMGELGDATLEVRGNGGDLTPLIDVMLRAQHFAREFCQKITDA